jgi:hypothetical protein
LYGGGAAIAASGSVVGTPLAAIAVGIVVAAAITVIPTVINTRKVLRAGYSLDDLRESLRMHWARRREELAVEAGESSPITVRTAAMWTGLSASLGIGTGMLVGGGEAIGAGLSIGLSTMFAGGAFALVRALRQRRARQKTPAHVRLWESKWGERIASLCSLRLTRVAAAQSIAPAATEVALGRATDALYGALPSALQKQLQHVPGTVRRLENDATVLRRQVQELESSIAALDSDSRTSREQSGTAERATLRTDLQRAREHSNGRLATTVAALETIRLGLMRLQIGAAPAESVTAVLEAARNVAVDIERAAEAQREVDRLLSSTQAFTTRV